MKKLEEKILINATLIFLIKDDRVCLAKKARKIGAGCWNGYGGGIEKGESPEIAAAREMQEECSVVVTPTSLTKMGEVDFHNTLTDGDKFVCKVHVFITSEWQGEPTAGDEMLEPTWFPIDQLPYDEMMPADRVWLPPIIQGKMIRAKACYGPYQKELLQLVEIKEF